MLSILRRVRENKQLNGLIYSTLLVTVRGPKTHVVEGTFNNKAQSFLKQFSRTIVLRIPSNITCRILLFITVPKVEFQTKLQLRSSTLPRRKLRVSTLSWTLYI